MIFAYLLLVIIVVTFMIYRFYAGEIRQRSELLFRQATEDVALQIDGIFEEMDTLSTQLLSSETLQGIFLEASESDDELNYFDRHITEMRTAQDILWAFNSPKSRIYNISIFNDSDYLGLRFNPSVNRVKAVSALPAWDEISADEFYRILPPHMSYWDTINRKQVVSLYRPYVASDYGFSQLGTIEIEEDYAKIVKICENGVPETVGRIIILDHAGSLVYPAAEETLIGENLQDVLSSPDESIEIDGERYRMAQASLGWAPWEVVLLQEEEYFSDPLRQFIRNLILVISALTLLVFFVIILIVNAVTRPISKLVDEIDGYSLDQGEPRFHEYPVKEVSVIQSAFIRLISRLRESVDELMLAHETELNLRIMNLQAKINPHFLFNSLTAISSIGMEEGSDTVPVMCAQLSNLFRYTSSTTEKGATTLKDEVDNIELYMDFMKWRFEQDFQFSVETEGDLAQVPVPKLILQPLIENSFNHGFRQTLPPYRIDVTASAAAPDWSLTLRDNGGGFTDEKLSCLQKGIRTVDEIFSRGKDYQELKTNDQAILNIYIRLKLQYRGSLSMTIGNRPEGGALIRIDSSIGGGEL